MREIKFRAWDTTSGYYDFMAFPSLERLGDYHECMGHEIMQYTGLKDKNGKEIYEGDIIDEGIVRFGIVDIEDNEGCSYNQVCGFYIKDLRFNDEYHMDLRDTEVIGNIHENPELLKES
mgnify:CR=1 FL=1|tara:strand:- start:6855 stop:7211 length:357 start_codon:yes stop_codon:yes gene_type:complete